MPATSKTFIMKCFLFAIVTLILFSSFNIGEPVATLTCKSESGRTQFNAVLPGASYLESAELSVDGSKYTFGRNDKSYIIFDHLSKVLTVYLESNDNNEKFLRFWAIPASFKTVSNEKGPGTQFHSVYEFKAKLEATDPRKGKELNTPTIELSCTLDYQL
jgi:hypothetical protein